MIEVLPAKSPNRGRTVSLKEHLFDTERAALELFQPGSPMLRDYVRFFRLPDQEEKFLVNVRVAALLHDLGKANSDFVEAVTGERRDQMLRHEHLSALVLFLPAVRAWLSAAPLVDFDVVVAAVLSHHFKAARDGDWRWADARRSGRIATWMSHPEVAATLQRVAAITAGSEPPALTSGEWPGPGWQACYEAGTQAARSFERTMRGDAARRALLVATKLGVVAADALSSGLVREQVSIGEWIRDVAQRAAISPDEVSADIIEPRIRQIGDRFKLDEFQARAAGLGDRALLLAPCGAGKTLAAWKWVQARLAERPAACVMFLYPTRGTATEGFRDYVGWAPETKGMLLHGTSRFDLDGMLENPPEALLGKDPRLGEASERLFALGLWPRRYFSATVDQLLGFLEHQYRSACLVPLLARSLVIVDEVHSFDRRLFDALLDFLRAFDVPVLAMTATLIPSRRRELEGVGLTPFPTAADMTSLTQLTEKARHPRYRLRKVTFEDALEEALRTHAGGARVLWVVNTVARCQEFASRAFALGIDALVYHSRFRLEDRRRVHDATVEAFKSSSPVFAITTQVCEMSLDLDAHTLVTELAPPSSLVQRFGRANRHLSRGDAFRAELLVYEPERPAPYSAEDFASARAFLQGLAGELSQDALAEALEKSARHEAAGASNTTKLLASGYYAVPGSLREDDAAGAPCVLDSDLPRLEQAVRAREPYDGLVLQVPRRAAHDPDPRPPFMPRHLRLAPAASYDSRLGFRMEA